jgi:hypothetical protein
VTDADAHPEPTPAAEETATVLVSSQLRSGRATTVTPT